MRVAFDHFELDLAGCVLTSHGRTVALERRPTEILCLLVTRAGDLVGRPEVTSHIWGAASGVDADMGLNTAIRKIRVALGDTAGAARFVETVQGRGYRFIAVVRPADAPAGAGSGDAVKIAVLPFDNLTGAPEQDHIADGFTEEVIARLGTVAPAFMHVVGRRSVLRFRNAADRVRDIGRELDVSHVVEGAVRLEGTTLRVGARLVACHDERQIWSTAYDGVRGDLLEFQQRVSIAVAERLRLQFAPLAQTQPLVRHTHSEEAYELYLQGRHSFNRNVSGTNQEAVGYFLRATEIDPGYSLAWSGLADVLGASPVNGDVPALSVWRQAREASRRAIETAPGAAEANASAGFVKFWLDWDWPAAERLFRRAAEIDPSYAFAHRMVGISSSHLGWHDAAQAAMRQAVILDPLFAMHYALSAMVAFQAGDFTKAASFARDAVRVDERFWIGHYQLGLALGACGESDAALTALAAAERICGNSSKPAMQRGYILARLGRREEARAELAKLAHIANLRFVPPYAFAIIHVGLNEREAALAALEDALAVRDVNLAFLKFDPKWRVLDGEKRFQAVLRHFDFTSGGNAEAEAGLRLQTVFRNAPWDAPAPAD